MGAIADNLTFQELIAAVHAIERAAGQSVFSPQYQAGIQEILDRAAAEGAADPARCRALARETSLAIPEPGQADDRGETLENVEVYGLSVLHGFPRGGASPRLVPSAGLRHSDRLRFGGSLANPPLVQTVVDLAESDHKALAMGRTVERHR